MRVRLNSRAVLALALGFAVAQVVAAEELRDLLRAPSRYHRQTVTVTGIARGDAGRFMLYSCLSDALNIGSQNYADVRSKDEWRRTPLVDLRRVRVVGDVNANNHGVWGNPCTIGLRKLEVLSGPVAPWNEKLDVFRNETGESIILRFGRPPTGTELEVRPLQSLDVHNAEDTSVVAIALHESEIARTQTSKHRPSPYYDATNAAFYYRVSKRAIQPVLPQDAKTWGWRR